VLDSLQPAMKNAGHAHYFGLQTSFRLTPHNPLSAQPKYGAGWVSLLSRIIIKKVFFLYPSNFFLHHINSRNRISKAKIVDLDFEKVILEYFCSLPFPKLTFVLRKLNSENNEVQEEI